MSSATRHVEGDPLEALRSELVAAGRRRVSRRRRGRRTAVVTGMLVGLLALTAGAGALINFSTGVPAVDTLLEIESPDSPGGSGRDIRPGPGQAAQPLQVPTGDGTANAVAYLARDGTICHATADGSARGSTGGCWRVADLVRALDRRKVVWNGLAAGADNRVFDGYADGDVAAIRVADGGDSITVKLSPPWTPRTAGAEPMRHFVVIDEADLDVGDDGVQTDETHLIAPPFPPLVVTLSDGTTRRTEPR